MATPPVRDSWIWKNPGPFRVGDRVRIPFGTESVEAIVVEDRGNLGVGGRRIYGIRFCVDDVSDEIYTERDADQLTLVARPPPAPATSPEEEACSGIGCRLTGAKWGCVSSNSTPGRSRLANARRCTGSHSVAGDAAT
jgi:hypothetical protein